MKILMLNYEFPPIGGGAGKANLCLLEEFSGRDDLQIDVLTSSPGVGNICEKFADNITIYKVGIHKKSLHYWRKTEVLEWLFKARGHYKKLIRKNRYDLVHAYFGFPTGYLCYRDFERTPYIISLRGSDVPNYNVRLGLDYKLLSGLFKKIWRNASAVVANSKGLSQLANEFMPELGIDVINNGIYMDRFFPAENKSLKTPVKLLTVCRLISRKRIDLLIEAVAKLKQSGVEVRLNIAGEGNLMEDLKSFAEELGVGQQVNFMGRIASENMPEVYRENDIFVMSSSHEGMSNAMLEAMSSGLAIVTTRCEGVEELISDNGVVVEDVNAEAISEAIASIVKDPGRYAVLCAASRKRAEQFGWGQVSQEYYDLYTKIAAGRNIPDKTVKVCFVVPKVYPVFNPDVKKVFGGAEVDLYFLGTELAKDENFKVSYVAADYGQQEIEYKEGAEIIKSLSFKENQLFGARKIWHAMKAEDADIYVIKTASVGVPLVRMFCKVYNKRFVYRSAHQRECDGGYAKKHFLLGKAFNWSLKTADAVLVQNKDNQESLEKTTGIRSEVIANGHRLGEVFDLHKDSILWVARSAEFKRPGFFIDLAKKNPEHSFVMVCQKATEDKNYDELVTYARQIANLDFYEGVEFSKIEDFFARAKIFVNTSRSEGFANTYIQACKHGAAILSLEVDPDRFIERNSCGVCCGGDVDRLQKGLDRLLLKDCYIEFGENGKKYVKANHDISKIIEVYKELFRELAG
jgi:L-malate glycosyltransferase